MRALRFYGAKDLRLDEIDEPTTSKGRVKVKPVFAGICGSDLNEYLFGPIVPPQTPHPLTNEKIPVTLGHEFSAIVEETSPALADISIGDKVAVFPLLADSTCDACQRGHPNLCASFGSIGYSGGLILIYIGVSLILGVTEGSGGGFSEHLVVPRENLFKLPDNVSLEEGALVEPLAVAWHAVKVSPFQKGDTALVIGAGPVGLALIAVLKAQGAGKILVSEVSKLRKELSQVFGAVVVDPAESDVRAKILEHSDDVGPSVVFDAAGVQTGLDLAMSVCRTGGTIVNLAIWKTKKPQIDDVALVMGEKKYVGSMGYLAEDFKQVIEAIGRGDLKPAAMVTKKIRLEDAVEQGFLALLESKDCHVKILIEV